MLPGTVSAWLAIPERQQVLLTPAVVATVHVMSLVSTGPLIAIFTQLQNMYWHDNRVVPFRFRWPQEYYADSSFGGWKPIVQETYWWNAILGFGLIMGGAVWCLKTDPVLSPYQEFQVISAGFQTAARWCCVEATVLLLCPFNMFNEDQFLTSLFFSIGLTVALFGGVSVIGIVYEIHNQDSEAPFEITITNQTKFFSEYFLKLTALCLATSWCKTFDLYLDSKAPMPSMAEPNAGNPQLRFFLKLFLYLALPAALFYLSTKIRELRRVLTETFPILEVMENEPRIIPNFEDAINEAEEMREAIARKREFQALDGTESEANTVTFQTPKAGSFEDDEDDEDMSSTQILDPTTQTLDQPLLGEGFG